MHPHMVWLGIGLTGLPVRAQGGSNDLCYLREPCACLNPLLCKPDNLDILPLDLLDFSAVRKRLVDLPLLSLLQGYRNYFRVADQQGGIFWFSLIARDNASLLGARVGVAVR